MDPFSTHPRRRYRAPRGSSPQAIAAAEARKVLNASGLGTFTVRAIQHKTGVRISWVDGPAARKVQELLASAELDWFRRPGLAYGDRIPVTFARSASREAFCLAAEHAPGQARAWIGHNDIPEPSRRHLALAVLSEHAREWSEPHFVYLLEHAAGHTDEQLELAAQLAAEDTALEVSELLELALQL